MSNTLSRLELATTQLLDYYTVMAQIRQFEDRVAELVEAGEIKCPCHLYTGQEAIAAGICMQLEKGDYVFGGHRSHGHYLAKGADLAQMMAEIYGKQTGCSRGRGGSMHLVAPEVGILGTVPIVAATIPLAVGTALASRIRGDGKVSVAFFGDGATEEGTFHESMNLAACKKLPVIFACENNLFSSHLHILERRAEDNIVKSADAHGMPGEWVDGNDILAMHQAAGEAIARARSGDGPTLLECRTYRWRGHVGPSYDIDVGLKRKDELTEWRLKDPIRRIRQMLADRDVPEERFNRIDRQIGEEIEAAVQAARAAPYPDGQELHDHLFRQRKSQPGAAETP